MHSGQLASQGWSEGLLADSYALNAAGLSDEAEPIRFPPTLYAASDDTLWLLDARGTLIRSAASGWEHVDAKLSSILGLAPQTDGSAVLLTQHAEGFALASIDRRGRTLWKRSSQELASTHPALRAATPRLLQDERGIPYLHVKTSQAWVLRVDVANGAVAQVAELKGYDAAVLVWQGAVWRIQFDGAHRQWIRRSFDGSDEVVLSGGLLDDTFLMAIAVAPHRGPVLTDGHRLFSVAPDARERAIPTPTLPAPSPPLPAVLDLLRAVARPNAIWVVYADGAGWSVHALPLE